jgi:hypothetical protein
LSGCPRNRSAVSPSCCLTAGSQQQGSDQRTRRQDSVCSNAYVAPSIAYANGNRLPTTFSRTLPVRLPFGRLRLAHPQPLSRVRCRRFRNNHSAAAYSRAIAVTFGSRKTQSFQVIRSHVCLRRHALKEVKALHKDKVVLSVQITRSGFVGTQITSGKCGKAYEAPFTTGDLRVTLASTGADAPSGLSVEGSRRSPGKR